MAGAEIPSNVIGTRTLLTLEQFDNLPEEESTVYELDAGELVVMTPRPAPRHSRIQGRLFRYLDRFVSDHGLGQVFIEVEFLLSTDTVRVPDIAFVTEKTIALDAPRIHGAPAIAVEIVSPGDRARDLTRKVNQYLAAGAAAVWVAHPETWEVHVFTADRTARILGENGTLVNQELLPGFELAVKAIFE